MKCRCSLKPILDRFQNNLMRLMEAVEIYRYLMNLALAGRLKIFNISESPPISIQSPSPSSSIKLHTFNGRRSTRRPSKGSAPPEAAGHEEVGIAMAWALEDRSGRSGKMLTSDLKIHQHVASCCIIFARTQLDRIIRSNHRKSSEDEHANSGKS